MSVTEKSTAPHQPTLPVNSPGLSVEDRADLLVLQRWYATGINSGEWEAPTVPVQQLSTRIFGTHERFSIPKIQAYDQAGWLEVPAATYMQALRHASAPVRRFVEWMESEGMDPLLMYDGPHQIVELVPEELQADVPVEFDELPRDAQDLIARKTGKTIRIDLGKNIWMTFLFIPGGTYKIGPDAPDAKGTVRLVDFLPSYLAESVVTIDQYNVLMGKEPLYGKDGAKPVDFQDFADLDNFLDRLNEVAARQHGVDVEKNGMEWGLAADVDWEHGVRGNTWHPFYFGPRASSKILNCNNSIEYDQYTLKGPNVGRPTPVCAYGIPNEYGIQGAHGEAWEGTLATILGQADS